MRQYPHDCPGIQAFSETLCLHPHLLLTPTGMPCAMPDAGAAVPDSFASGAMLSSCAISVM